MRADRSLQSTTFTSQPAFPCPLQRGGARTQQKEEARACRRCSRSPQEEKEEVKSRLAQDQRLRLYGCCISPPMHLAMMYAQSQSRSLSPRVSVSVCSSCRGERSGEGRRLLLSMQVRISCKQEGLERRGIRPLSEARARKGVTPAGQTPAMGHPLKSPGGSLPRAQRRELRSRTGLRSRRSLSPRLSLPRSRSRSRSDEPPGGGPLRSARSRDRDDPRRLLPPPPRPGGLRERSRPLPASRLDPERYSSPPPLPTLPRSRESRESRKSRSRSRALAGPPKPPPPPPRPASLSREGW
jgi:hypothetical protein